MENEITLGFEVNLDLEFDNAIDAVIDALKIEGFGVLTRIDVDKTLKEKLDENFRPYAILGACNPPLAHRALTIESLTGLMLPCNVTVEDDLSGGSIVRIANPEVMMQVGTLEDNDDLKDVAKQARIRLEQVAKLLSETE
jgi:uncharacterized protein (DUF302 family)